MSRRIPQDEEDRILKSIYSGNTRPETATITGHSSDTVHRKWKQHEKEVKEKGLERALQNHHLNEALELNMFGGELKKNGVTVPDCKQALPLVLACRRLGVGAEDAMQFLEAAVEAGQGELPLQDYVKAVARIYNREKTSGLTIEQVDSEHARTVQEVQQLRLEHLSQKKRVASLRRQEIELNSGIQAGQKQLAYVTARLQEADVTAQYLPVYVADKIQLKRLNVDIKDSRKVCAVFDQLRMLNYNPLAVIAALTYTGNLEAYRNKLLKEVTAFQQSLKALQQQKATSQQEIQRLENIRVDSEKRAQEAEQSSKKRMQESDRRVQEKLDLEKITLQVLEDFRITRALWARAGIPSDDTQLITRILQELKARGYDPFEVVRQLALNVTLEAFTAEREEINRSLTRTKGEILRRISLFQAQEHAALIRRDQLLNEVKDLHAEMEKGPRPPNS